MFTRFTCYITVLSRLLLRTCLNVKDAFVINCVRNLTKSYVIFYRICDVLLFRLVDINVADLLVYILYIHRFLIRVLKLSSTV